MKMPNLTQSAETFVKEFGLYHFTRLSADASLRDMASRWDSQQSRLKSRILDLEKAHGETMIAMAARDGSARVLAEAVRAFYGTLVAKTNNNRKSPLFKTYFPDGLRAMLGVALQAETQRVGVMVNKLIQEADADLYAHFAPLSKALSGLGEATGTYDAANEAERLAFGRIEQEKFAWLDLYKLDHRTLEQMFYKDSTKADSYFKPARKPKAKVTPAISPAVHLAPSQEATA
jgi:hypothetical protein